MVKKERGERRGKERGVSRGKERGGKKRKRRGKVENKQIKVDYRKGKMQRNEDMRVVGWR